MPSKTAQLTSCLMGIACPCSLPAEQTSLLHLCWQRAATRRAAAQHVPGMLGETSAMRRASLEQRRSNLGQQEEGGMWPHTEISRLAPSTTCDFWHTQNPADSHAKENSHIENPGAWCLCRAAGQSPALSPLCLQPCSELCPQATNAEQRGTVPHGPEGAVGTGRSTGTGCIYTPHMLQCNRPLGLTALMGTS